MVLPEDFTKRMQELLGDGYSSFIYSFDKEKVQGLRINTLKLNIRDKDRLPFGLEGVPWAEEGFYYNQDTRPGLHPLHDAGAYYIQEPSAMAVTGLLAPEPGNIICDLCAAPGGKSTHIAGRLNGRGLLVSNEISGKRARVLSQNIERAGICNALVCNETPEHLAKYFPDFFDKILVDAPCSGEGMFRKDNTAIEEWSLDNVNMCAARQKMILGYADKMLKPGGVIVYSTCTFSPAEDEDMLVWFLRKYKGYNTEGWQGSKPCGLYSGRRDFVSESFGKLSGKEEEAIANAIRIWPHKARGEGHFAFRLRKYNIDYSVQEDNNAHYIKNKQSRQKPRAGGRDKGSPYISRKELEEIRKFFGDILGSLDIKNYAKRLRFFGGSLFLLPDIPELLQSSELSGSNSHDGLKITRAGLQVAIRRKNRLEPAHSLAHALKPEDARQYQDCSYDMALKFLHGEQISCNPVYKGWVLLGYSGFPLGWGKAVNGTVKNHYPKGLRSLSLN